MFWTARTRAPHSGLRTSLSVSRLTSGILDSPLHMRERVLWEDPELDKALWLGGPRADDVHALVKPAAVRAAIQALFALCDPKSKAPLVEELSITESGRAEVRPAQVRAHNVADAQNIVRLTIEVLTAMRTSIDELPSEPPGQRARDLDLARRIVTDGVTDGVTDSVTDSATYGVTDGVTDGATGDALDASTLLNVRHRLDGDLYVCTGVLEHWLPTLSLFVGRPRSSQDTGGAPPRMLKSPSDIFTLALTTARALQAPLTVPMTSLEIRRHGPQSSEVTFKRLWRRTDDASGRQGVEGADPRLGAHIAQAISDLRRIVAALEILAQRVDWRSTVSFLHLDAKEPSPESAAKPAPESSTPTGHGADAHARRVAADDALFDVVVTATERWSGHVDKVGAGVQARVTRPLGETELRAVLTVEQGASGASVTMTAELPHASGAPLSLSPERGLAAWVRSMRELEVGIDPLDRAFLVEGNPARIPEVSAAQVPLVKLADHELQVTLHEQELSLATPSTLRTTEVEAAISAALELWEAVGHQRSGLAGGP